MDLNHNLRTGFVNTTQGRISYCESLGEGHPVLFIHGNSACKESFEFQLKSELAKKYHFVALTLPGHMGSDNAYNPEETYSLPGYAKVVIEFIEKFNLMKPTIVGWSLGGNLAFDILATSNLLAGVLVTGAPPISITPEGFKNGYLPITAIINLMPKAVFTHDEAKEFHAQGGYDVVKYPYIVDAALKTDEKARPYLMKSCGEGKGCNEKEIAETNNTPLCIVAGSEDKGVNNEFIMRESVNYKHLFQKKVFIINAGHAVFCEKPDEFNDILGSFLKYVYKD